MATLFTVIAIGVCVLLIVAVARNRSADDINTSQAGPTKLTKDGSK